VASLIRISSCCYCSAAATAFSYIDVTRSYYKPQQTLRGVLSFLDTFTIGRSKQNKL